MGQRSMGQRSKSARRASAGGTTRIAAVVLLCVAAACRDEVRLVSTDERVLARDELVTLMVADSSHERVMRLVPQPGVRINAQLLPVIDVGAVTDAGSSREPRITFDAPGRSDDSAYFVLPPTARVPASRAVKGILRGSACPEGKKVCLSVALDVTLP